MILHNDIISCMALIDLLNQVLAKCYEPHHLIKLHHSIIHCKRVFGYQKPMKAYPRITNRLEKRKI